MTFFGSPRALVAMMGLCLVLQAAVSSNARGQITGFSQGICHRGRLVRP
jgi:hypothetical protein